MAIVRKIPIAHRLVRSCNWADTSTWAGWVEKIKPYGEAKAILESTGNFWIKSYEALEKADIHVSLSNSLKTRVIAEAHIKTDRMDARLLAHLLRANLMAESYFQARKPAIDERYSGIEAASSRREQKSRTASTTYSTNTISNPCS